MKKTVLILGGYGNFGSVIAAKLAQEKDMQVIVAGRSADKAKSLADTIGAQSAVMDVQKGFDAALEVLRPHIVIHTSGPFQEQGYDVAQACIRHKCHYIDLADGRRFVKGIGVLDAAARAAGVLVVAGASSVPCLTSAILDRYKSQFERLTDIDYAIATAQRSTPGLATTQAILGYAGKPFTTLIDGKSAIVYGWQNLTARRYPGLGVRLLANCDIPDFELFPERYPALREMRFRAGLEVPFVHLSLWALSWLVRLRVLKTLKPFARALHTANRWFDFLGSERSGFHMEMRGTGLDGADKTITFYILTGSGHGPNIPCIPSILLAQRLARGDISQTGALPCMGLIDLDAYLEGLAPHDIRWVVRD